MLTISPSKIARYFYYDCERYLIYEATSKQEKQARGFYIPEFKHRPVTEAILKAGYRWEEEVIDKIIKTRVHIAPKKDTESRLCNRQHNAENTEGILRKISNGEYLYQGCLIPPQSFYDTYKIDRSLVTFGNCYPDLIFAGNGNSNELQIIDIKSTDEMKTSHKIQVALYALLLNHICKEKNIKLQADLSRGGVWTYGMKESQWFNIKTVIPQVEEMLYIDLPRISKMDINSLHWHIHYRCEWCDYYEHCRKEADETKSISLIPHLSSFGRKYLTSDEIKVNNLHEMKEFLELENIKSLTSGCASLTGKEKRLIKSVESLLNGKIYSYEASTLEMPKYEEIKLLLTIQKEPVSGEIYTAAILRTGCDDIFASKNRHEEQFTATSIDDCKRVRCEFINRIYEIFKEIHDYNEGREWQDQKSVQTYVFDLFEWDLLKKLLIDSLKDPVTAGKALPLFFYFHSEDLLSSDEHPENEVSFPVVIITKVIHALFALPIPVAYQLSTVADIFTTESDKKFNYQPSDYFTFHLSNSLRSDAIYSVWEKGKTENITSISQELKIRLWATIYIINGIRAFASKSNHPILFAYPLKFHFPTVQDIKNPVLSRLAFITRYESIIQCISISSKRSLPRDEREHKKTAFTLTAIDDNGKFSVHPKENLKYIDKGEPWLLSEDTTEGDMIQMMFNDFYYKNKFHYVPKNKALYLANITNIDLSGYIILDMIKGDASPQIVIGNKYLFQKRFTDVNSQRVIKRIIELDKDNNLETVKLLKNPIDCYKDITKDTKFKNKIYEMAENLPFTGSQKEAFYHLIDKNLTLLWGPPGTGKTYFIAIAILALLEIYRREDRPFRILLSAFTHTAIENCLKKILDLNSSLNIWQNECNVVKLSRLSTHIENLDIIEAEKGPAYLLDNNRCVIGGTTYSLYNFFKKNRKKDSPTPFDMIVIDEGSQVRVPESFMVISRLKSEGRLLIAGDDKQLPPIIQGYYSDPEPNEPLLHRSVFEALREQDRDKNEITCQLLENFRMNKTLCLYPAEKIYSKQYQSANSEISLRKLTLTNMAKLDLMMNTILDPEYPLVICVMEGVRTGAENLIEAELVAEITSKLREKLCNGKTNNPYPDDEDGDKLFWKDGLFIVSPHHVQIDAICDALSIKGLRGPYFVDSVDKMQGQECNVVIVSYGVSDPELAVREDEFIYSLNRLNVAITRAKCKSIVFLSRHLLKPSIHALTKSETEEGISFMIGLERFASQGDKKIFEIPKHPKASLLIYRI